jgi:predicted RNA binding protein YcfA (HicA-like mRNA interferase family)
MKTVKLKTELPKPLADEPEAGRKRARADPSQFTGKDLVKVFVNKCGYEVSRQKGAHAVLKKLDGDGVTSTIVVPVHPTELGPSLVKTIVHETGMTWDQFSARAAAGHNH